MLDEAPPKLNQDLRLIDIMKQGSGLMGKVVRGLTLKIGQIHQFNETTDLTQCQPRETASWGLGG